MAIIAKEAGSGKEFTPLEAGSYLGRCYSLIHIGTAEELYLGEPKVQNKIQITFELPTELKVFKEENGPQPVVFSKDFTLSLHPKAGLRKFLESWRGKSFTEAELKGFDLASLLGVPCQLSIAHKTNEAGKTYANIVGISLPMKGTTVPPQVNPTFEFNYDPFDQAKFDSLSEFVKEKIRKTDEYKAATSGGAVVAPSAAPDAQKFEQAAPAQEKSRAQAIIESLDGKSLTDWDTIAPTLPKDLSEAEVEEIKSGLMPF